MKWDHVKTARERGIVVDRSHGTKDAEFPVEVARLRKAHYLTLATCFGIIGYGWALRYKAVSCKRGIGMYTYVLMLTVPTLLQHMAVALVLQFMLGGTITCMFIVRTMPFFSQ